MKSKFKVKLARLASKLFPPLISQRLRDFLYPIHLAREEQLSFIYKSITGSYLSNNTIDYHAYRFFIHGFFDWRNVIIANSVSKFTKGDILEVGANIGTETISFCDISKGSSKVFAFEPLPTNFEHLKLISNDHDCLKLYNYALSDNCGEEKFLIPPKVSSGTGKILIANEDNDSKYISVKTKKLDNFIDEYNNVNILFIDVEGHEPYVLRGAIETLKKYNPIVVIEASPKLLLKYAHLKLDYIYKFFEDLNYEVLKISKLTIKKVNEADLNSDKPSNWICVPKSKKDIKNQIKTDLILRSIIPWYLLKKLPYRK